METKCPVCGSSDVRVEKVDETLTVPYGPAATFTTTQSTCNTCGESGDFSGENTAIINEALRKSVSASASAILEHLAKEGVSAAYFERAMRLPARTTARWKAGELSSAALALLRSVCTYPWLLEVSDADFEPYAAKRKLVEAAAGVFAPFLQERVSKARMSVAVSSNQVSVAAELRFHGQNEQVSTQSSEQLTYLEPVDLLPTV